MIHCSKPAGGVGGQSGGGSSVCGTASWRRIRRRHASCTAGTATDARTTHTSSSTFWATPSDPDRPKAGEGRCSPASCRPSAARPPRPSVAEVRGWNLHRMSRLGVGGPVSRIFNAKIRGWVNYYGRYYPTAAAVGPCASLNRRLVRWAQRKYKRFQAHRGAGDAMADPPGTRQPDAVCSLAARSRAMNDGDGMIGAG